jgi:hypothetical protein
MKPINGILTTITLAPARGAFLTLVRYNVRNLANIMNEANLANAAALHNKWNDLGGNYYSLLDMVNIGIKKRSIGEVSESSEVSSSSDIVNTIQIAIKVITALIAFINLGREKLSQKTGQNVPIPFDEKPPAQQFGINTQDILIIGAGLLLFSLINGDKKKAA